MVSMKHLAALMLLAGFCSSVYAVGGGSVEVCLLKFKVDSKQSAFSGSGTTTAPIPGKVSPSKLTATGEVWLRVPPTTSCPPNLTAENIDDLLQQSSLEVPVGASSITFLPVNITSNVTATDSKEPLSQMNLLGLGIGLTGEASNNSNSSSSSSSSRCNGMHIIQAPVLNPATHVESQSCRGDTVTVLVDAVV
jgi:hypothetical protein